MDRLEISVEATALLGAMARFGDAADVYLKAAALETAERIADEARARVARREGKTASNIVASANLPEWLGGGPSYNKTAAFVYVRAQGRPDNLSIWLEFGTEKMLAQPFLFDSARLEEGPFLRRAEAALQDAINELGLGV